MAEPLSDYDYDLPPERIAQAPLAERSTSRLLVLDRTGVRPPEHRTFSDVVELVPPGAVVVLNETRVIPARLLGRRATTGGRAELLLVGPVPGCPHGDWEALVQTGGKPQPGEELVLGEDGARVTLVGLAAPGRWRVRFPAGAGALDVAAAHGQLPLPPYIKRAPGPEDDATYQTVYARVPGAIAAPTAGLHFTPALLAALEARGVTVARLVLHVGLGTFCPVRVEDLGAHVMHAERYVVPPATRAAVEAARRDGRKVVAVGTTAVRALEAWAHRPGRGGDELFIRPGFRFQAVDAMVTNFHLPRSTLLALVAAFAGRERMLAAYAEAVARGYRFYSYGDAMFIA